MNSTRLILLHKINSLKKELDFYENKFEQLNNEHALDNENLDLFIEHTKPIELEFSTKEERIGFRSLVYNVPDMIMRFDRQYRHLFVNLSSVRILKRKVSDFLGANHRQLGFDEEKCQLWEKAMESVFLFKKDKTIEFDIIVDGEKKYFEWRLIPEFNAYNDVATILSIARDITKRVLVEKKLQMHLKTKDKFFSIISHDLKSPLSTICNFSKLLVDNIENIDKEELSEYLELISSSASNTFSLLEKILQWARTQEGFLTPEPTNINVLSLLKDNLILYKEKAFEKKINITIKCKANIYTFADDDMLNVIIRNLLSNALKYTNVNGNINMSAYIEGDYLIICIKDDGIGIPEAYKDALLKLDVNFNREGTSKEIGTGVGLKLCVEFADIINAKLSFVSKENVGSEFFIKLPIENKH